MKTVWPLASVESLCTRVTSGGTPSRSNSAYYENGTIPWIKTGELKDWYVDAIQEKITEVALRESSAKLFPPDTVLLAMYGDGKTMGSVGLLRKSCATNQACCAMLPDPAKCDPKFLLYSLIYFRPAILKLTIAGAQRNLNGKTIKQFKIGAPDLEDQRRIASILSAYDNLIENNTRRIAILEEMARRIYEEWFVRFHFPGHEQVKRVESELGLIPEGWRVGSLGEAAAINARSIRPADAPLEILYIDIASVVPGAITQKQPYRFSEAPGRARRVVGHGDVIWSCVRPNRRSYALILQPEPALIASTGFAVLSAKSVPYSYLYFAVTTDDFVGFLTNHATGAAYPAVTASTFEAAPFLIPEEEVADQFHAVVAPMLDLSETLKRKNANLRATRDLLLPKLISGELDVSTLSEPTV